MTIVFLKYKENNENTVNKTKRPKANILNGTNDH